MTKNSFQIPVSSLEWNTPSKSEQNKILEYLQNESEEPFDPDIEYVIAYQDNVMDALYDSASTAIMSLVSTMFNRVEDFEHHRLIDDYPEDENTPGQVQTHFGTISGSDSGLDIVSLKNDVTQSFI